MESDSVGLPLRASRSIGITNPRINRLTDNVMKLTEACNAVAGQEAAMVTWVPIEDKK